MSLWERATRHTRTCVIQSKLQIWHLSGIELELHVSNSWRSSVLLAKITVCITHVSIILSDRGCCAHVRAGLWKIKAATWECKKREIVCCKWECGCPLIDMQVCHTNFGGEGDSWHFGPMCLLFLNWCRECFAACEVFFLFFLFASNTMAWEKEIEWKEILAWDLMAWEKEIQWKEI